MPTQLEITLETEDISTIQHELRIYLMNHPQDNDGQLARVITVINEKQFEVWMAHDGKKLIEEPTKWNQSYLAEQQIELHNNFSKERFLHMMTVANFLASDPTNEAPVEPFKLYGVSMGTIMTVGVIIFCIIGIAMVVFIRNQYI
ncbi:hypothetical protein JFL43_03665 [Viridibacillus sp. YIM B01967]|uniref:Hydrolase n=1 Tax=Viridibacillus soli TaxID=2798301 RepID=A0ABS1H3J0_9BACL|nr:hypothetical protein [Viridibacillus soli]MBK3493969.1 hypothetical protein [Viridibacillus soli]